MTILRTLLATSVLLPLAIAARADTARAPYESVRALKRLQEQVAKGSVTAHKAQAGLMTDIGASFVQADPMVWRDPRNARAAALYLFSGGKPLVVRTVLSRSTIPHDLDRLIKGALAYAEGQDQIARDLLEPIDPKAQPAIIGGPLALVEATLFANTDAKKAMRFLDLARLLVPGTLVEEAALRRQIQMQTEPAALPRFVALSRQYLHRFQNSIYAQNFKQHFAAAAVQLGRGGDVAILAKLDPVIVELPAEEQRALYLAMAKAAMIAGHTDAARLEASRAASTTGASAADAARARLYLDATAIASGDVAKGISGLESSDAARLSPDDTDLRDAAIAVARSVEAPVPEALAGAPAGAAADDDASRLAQAARQRLQDGDDLLRKAN